MTPKYIIIHHTAVSYDLNNNQFAAVNRYHINKGWGKIGYHYLIEPNGAIKKGRKDNEVGAHCIEQNMNYHSLGVCITGNFDKDIMTPQQVFACRDLLQSLCRQFKISRQNIYLHRNFAKYKSCPGKNISLEFMRNLSVKSY